MKKVLLIEDEPHIIEALTFLLEQEGCEVSSHSDGALAAHKAASYAPDLIILDVMLPGKSGFEIFDEIRSHAHLASTPVLMLTAKGQTKDREAAERAGVNVFMTKPFSNQEVLDNVNRLINS
jgi:DNA-binding response OmpR family regulator